MVAMGVVVVRARSAIPLIPQFYGDFDMLAEAESRKMWPTEMLSPKLPVSKFIMT